MPILYSDPASFVIPNMGVFSVCVFCREKLDLSIMPSCVPFCYQCEEKKHIDELITKGIEEGMEVRSVLFFFAAACFNRKSAN